MKDCYEVELEFKENGKKEMAQINMITNHDAENEKIEAHIAPWALPNEDIPLHFKWEKNLQWDEIIIEVPTGFKIVDFLNVKKKSINKNTIKISEVKDIEATQKMYFGIIVSYPKIPSSLSHGGKIKTTFLKNGKNISEIELLAKVFRPNLEVIKVPQKLTLADKKSPTHLPLQLRYIGFGDVQLKIEARIKGKIVSQGESLVYEILKRLHESGVLQVKEIQTEEDTRSKDGIWLDPEYVKKIAEDISQRIEMGKILTEEIDKDMIKELRSWLADLKTREKFVEMLYGRIKEILLSILMDLLMSTPIDNVKLMDPRTRMRAKIKVPITDTYLKIYYRDLMLNEYSPVEISLKIEDIREKPTEVIIDLPIIIEKWDNKPYLNVRNMSI